MKQGNKNTVKPIAHRKDNKAIFQEAMQGVTRIDTPNKIIPTPQAVSPMPRHTLDHIPSPDENTLSDHIASAVNEGGAESFQQPGISRQMLRQLRRGHWKVRAYLDLHGMTRDEARQELVVFLDACRNRDYRCVCIIHGKGIGSKNRTPVLKTRIGGWLAQREDVLAFCPAKPENGGNGATLVLLKKSYLL